MKIENLGTKILLFITVAIFAFMFDMSFGDWVYRHYEAVAKSILDLTLLVMMYRYILLKGLAKFPDRASITTVNLKFIVFGLFWFAVAYWAIRDLVDMIIYYVVFWLGMGH